MSSAPRVIIFGPTGAVGRAAALESHRLGAHVTLAMRDPSRTTPDLLSTLPRLQADLSNPTTLAPAITQSRATAAFVYALNDMLPTFTALASAGISYIVLLSSWTIYPLDPHTAATQSHAIPARHAKAEVALQQAGLKFAAIRPLYFASNVLYEREGINRGELDLLNPDGVWDYIASEDIGTVAGARLVAEPAAMQSEVIPIMGPQLLSQRAAWGIIAKEFNREINIKEITFDEFMRSHGEGNEGARSLAVGTVRTDEEKYPAERCEVARGNVRRWAGREGMGFAEWVQRHRDELSGLS